MALEIMAVGLLSVKAEVTPGTDPTPTLAANLIPVADGKLNFKVNTTPLKRSNLDGGLGKLVGFNTLPNVEISFDYELRGNRTDGTVPDISAGAVGQKVEIDALLQAANLTPTYTTELSGGSRDGNVIYTLASPVTQGPTVTCYWYSALKLHKLTYGKVSVAFNGQAGKMGRLTFTIKGKYTAISDNTFSTSGAAFLAIKAPLFLPSVMTLGAYTPVVEMFKWDLKNDIQMRSNVVASTGDGVEGFVIGDRAPSGEINPESVTEAANPAWADLIASTVKTTTVTVGAQTGNKYSIILNAEYKDVNYAERNKVRVHGIKFDIVQASFAATVGSEFQLKFF